MFRRSSLTFSGLLLKEIANGRSKETACGIQRAVALTQHLLMIPHINAIDFSLSMFGSQERTFFEKGMNGGVGLRNHMLSVDRVATLITLDGIPSNKNSNVHVRLYGFNSGSKDPRFELNSLIHHRFGYLVSLNFYEHTGGDYHSLEFRVCEDCHGRGQHWINMVHRVGCPSLNSGNINERLEYDRGVDDGYRRRDQQVGGQCYNLGHDVGGITYQADLALGRISPTI